MKTTTLASLLAATSLGMIALPAAAQSILSLNERQMQLDARIEAGLRQGGLTRAEADRLQAVSRDVRDLAERYRRTGGGLDARERADLERRQLALSDTIDVTVKYRF